MITENDLLKIEYELCRKSLFEFIQSINIEYKYIWYHKVIADKVQDVIEGRIKKLMVFIPPQHQKSTISSRCAPAWALGKNPNLKIIHAAYGVDLVEGFSRDIQRIIDNEFYQVVFPETKLNNSNIRTQSKNYVRTVEKWEIVNKKGSYFCAGVGGGITGKACDIGIIDDPIKGAMDANSPTVRNKVWEWYLQDFRTRLHNNSKQIIIQTRWHNDDLSGRILDRENDWHVVSIPAIKEDNNSDYDIRNIGEALYPQMHSVERLNEIKQLSPRTFAALYQQRPSIEGGNIIKREWFRFITADEFKRIVRQPKIDYFLDTAFTEKTSNDPSGIMATCFYNGNLYIYGADKVRLEFPELIKYIQSYVTTHGYTYSSAVYIEPKANGKSVIQQLKRETKLNIIEGISPKESKETRLNVASPTIQSGKVYLISDTWNEDFINEICAFPAAKHDEYVDLISYAIEHYFNYDDFQINYIH